jgi:hypothetical protein
MDFIHVVHDRDVLQALVSWVMNLWVLKNMGNSCIARQLLAFKGLIFTELI